MWTLRDRYCIAGIGETAYTKVSGRTVLDLASEACLKAVRDAGVAVDDIDGIVSFHFNDSVRAIAMATNLGIPAAMNASTKPAAAAIEAGLESCPVDNFT
jgi:3-oxoacyl-[acyl-carrier-protein] synthase III